MNKQGITILTGALFLLITLADKSLAQNANQQEREENSVGFTQQKLDSLALHATDKELDKLFLYNPKLYYKIIQKQYAEAKRNNAFKKKGKLLSQLGEVEAALGLLDDARIHFYESLEIAELQNDQELKSKCLEQLGNFYYLKDKLLDALNNYQASINAATLVKDETIRETRLATNYSMIGLIYCKLEMFDTSMKHLLKGKKICEKLGDRDRLAHIYGLISFSSLQQKNYPEALHYQLKKLESFQKKEGLRYGNACSELGRIYQNLEEIQLARQYYTEALEILSFADYKWGMVECLTGLAEIDLDQHKNIDSVILRGKKALELGIELESPLSIKDASKVLYRAYKLEGNSKLALEMNELYEKTIKELNIAEQSEQMKIASLRTKMLTQQKRLANKNEQIVQKEQTKKRNTMIVFITILIITVGFILFLVRKIRKNRNNRQELLSKIVTLQALEQSSTSMLPVEKTDNSLNKELISQYADNKINETDWSILTYLAKTPGCTNREIAAAVFMSYDGVLSSLKKMYKLFDISVTRNHKLELIIKVSEISKEKKGS